MSSANVSGAPAALTCAEAVEQLGDRVAVYLDGGRVTGGVASTIVDFVADPKGRIVREGALSLEELQAVVAGILPKDEPEPEPEPESEPVAEAEPEPESEPVAEPEPEA